MQWYEMMGTFYIYDFIVFSLRELFRVLHPLLDILLARNSLNFVSSITIYSLGGIFTVAGQRYCWNDEEISVYHLIFLQSISNLTFFQDDSP